MVICLLVAGQVYAKRKLMKERVDSWLQGSTDAPALRGDRINGEEPENDDLHIPVSDSLLILGLMSGAYIAYRNKKHLFSENKQSDLQT